MFPLSHITVQIGDDVSTTKKRGKRFSALPLSHITVQIGIDVPSFRLAQLWKAQHTERM